MPDIPFPEVIDSSLLSAFRSCPRKCELEYFRHWKPKDQSVHLHAGAAFARGLEVAREAFFVEEVSAPVAVGRGVAALWQFYGDFDCPEDSPKSALRMAGALEYSFSEEAWPLETERAIPVTLPSGARGIEFSFLEPLDIAHPVTGNPLLFSGRFDQVVEYAGGIFGEDDKTTGQLGATWAKQWDLRSQFDAYCWGAARAGMPLQGMLVRGVAIRKVGYDHAQTPTYRALWQIERWYEQTLEDIRRMIRMWERGRWDYNLDHACTEYGGCLFRQPCLAQDPQPWLEIGFQRRRWDPVTREETVL